MPSRHHHRPSIHYWMSLTASDNYNRTCHNKVGQWFTVVGSPQIPSLAQTQVLLEPKDKLVEQTPGRGASSEGSLQNPPMVMR